MASAFPTSILSLSDEALLMILRKLNSSSLYQIHQTCQRFFHLSEDWSLTNGTVVDVIWSCPINGCHSLTIRVIKKSILTKFNKYFSTTEKCSALLRVKFRLPSTELAGGKIENKMKVSKSKPVYCSTLRVLYTGSCSLICTRTQWVVS